MYRVLIAEFEATENFRMRKENCMNLKKAGISISQMKENSTSKQWIFQV